MALFLFNNPYTRYEYSPSSSIFGAHNVVRASLRSAVPPTRVRTVRLGAARRLKRHSMEALLRYCCCCCPEWLRRRDTKYSARGRKVLDEIEMEFVDDYDVDDGLTLAYDMTRCVVPLTVSSCGLRTLLTRGAPFRLAGVPTSVACRFRGPQSLAPRGVRWRTGRTEHTRVRCCLRSGDGAWEGRWSAPCSESRGDV